MSNPVTFSQVIEDKKATQEHDRSPIKVGDVFVITSIFIDDNTKFEAIAKINGYDIIGNIRIKKRSTAKKIVSQCKDMINLYNGGNNGNLSKEIKVEVVEYTTANGQRSMEFR